MKESCSITISSPMKQDFIIELLDQKTINDITFSFVSKKGIALTFDCDQGQKEAAIAAAKAEIKATEIGKVLYFQVV